MRDPYQALGVSRDASDEEIKKAYRALSRKYHPDANVNNPNKDQAEEKFKQIQQAYQQIMDERQRGAAGGGSYGSGSYGNGSYGGGSYGGSSYGGYDGRDFGGFGDFGDFFGGFGFGGQSYRRTQNGAGDDEYTVHMNAAWNYIQSRHFREALNVLSDIGDHTARWYYYSSVANAGLGNNVAALEHAKRAAAMEPDNMQYRQWVSQLESGGSWYQTQQTSYGMPVMEGNSWCLRLCIANLICNLCCGGGGMCCGGGVPMGRF